MRSNLFQNKKSNPIDIWSNRKSLRVGKTKKLNKMKNLKLILIITIVGAMTFFASSCKEQGCTDPTATNYNADADEDDCSCEYSGRLVFWFNDDVSNNLIAAGVTTLTCYVDDVEVGTMDPADSYINSPACGQNGALTVTQDLGLDKEKTLVYEIKNQDGVVYWTGNINFKSNTCVTLQLTWNSNKAC